jgi:hypothetical protein
VSEEKVDPTLRESKHLFDFGRINEGWTDEASKFDSEVSGFLRELFQRADKQGFSLRQLAYLVVNEVMNICSETIIVRGTRLRPKSSFSETGKLADASRKEGLAAGGRVRCGG